MKGSFCEILHELKYSINASGSIFGSHNLLAGIDDNLMDSCEYIFTTSYLTHTPYSQMADTREKTGA